MIDGWDGLGPLENPMPEWRKMGVDIEENLRLLKLIRKEPAWALSRVERATELEGRIDLAIELLGADDPEAALDALRGNTVEPRPDETDLTKPVRYEW